MRASASPGAESQGTEFVLAARSLGASHGRILVRHLLPNILQPVLIQATIGMAGAILAESTLSFLGLGVLAPLPSWGAMLNDARTHLFDAPHMVVFPALAVMTAVLAFNLLGDAWRDWLDPRTRSQMAALEIPAEETSRRAEIPQGSQNCTRTETPPASSPTAKTHVHVIPNPPPFPGG